MTELEMLKKAMDMELYECAVTDHLGVRRMMDIPQVVELLEMAETEGTEEPSLWRYNEEGDLSMGAYMIDETNGPAGITIEFY